jgi:hypothetical protein
MLKGMKDAELISWTDSAQMVDGATGEIVTNSNLYNILNNVFNPSSRGHPTRYVPTGLDEFVDKMMEWQRERGIVPDEVVLAVEAVAANGQRRWTMRQDRDGTWVSLTRLWNLLRDAFPLARMGINNLSVFIQVMQTLGLVNFAWHAWLGRMQMAAGMGTRTPWRSLARVGRNPYLPSWTT